MEESEWESEPLLREQVNKNKNNSCYFSRPFIVCHFNEETVAPNSNRK